jgi:ubiquitin carboxyl-terminal hydrolase 9/13
MTEADKAATEPPKADLGDAVPVPLTPAKTKEDKKELRAQDKARKAAEKERLKQEAIEKAEAQKEAARRREENFTRMRENRKREQEEMQKVIEESKRMAAEEERRRKAEAVDKEQTSAVADTTGSNTPAVKPMLGLLNRANRGSKSLSRKSFGFLSKGDKGDDPSSPAPDTPRTTLQQNGSSSPITPIPDEDKPLKRHFSFAMGRKKSGKFAS